MVGGKNVDDIWSIDGGKLFVNMPVLNMVTQQQFSVLLVEDDDVDVMNVKRALRKNLLDIPLYRAANGVEALSVLRNWRAQGSGDTDKLVVLLDLNMPKMGGLEFLRVLRHDTQFRNIPVIVLTTSSQEKDLEAAYELNVAGYIVKPVDFHNFVEIIGVISRYWSLCEMPTQHLGK